MTPVTTLSKTPIEVHPVDGVNVLVKREDLCWPFPPLSKARGVYAAMEARPDVRVMAVVDTGRSLNGQLVATIGLTLGRKVLVGYPRYVRDPEAIPGPCLAVRSLGVPLVPLVAGRQFTMLYEMANHLIQTVDESWFLFPTGLRLKETVAAVEAETRMAVAEANPGCVVVPTGTGTHLAGVLRGFEGHVIAVQGYAREEQRFRRDVERMTGLGPCIQNRLRVVTSMCDYYENRAERLPPFPAHAHYEVRAWAWMHTPGVMETLRQPVLMWNIGA